MISIETEKKLNKNKERNAFLSIYLFIYIFKSFLKIPKLSDNVQLFFWSLIKLIYLFIIIF